MSVKIRLKRIGTIKQPHWRVVVTNIASPREGRYIEELGHYDPRTNPVGLKINVERYRYWIGVGAQVSDTVKSLVKRQEKKR